jgi:hypothetical protein
MPKTSSKATAAASTAALEPISFNELLEKLTPKDRLNATRHLTACEAEPDPHHANLWRKLMCVLATLATHSIKFNGRESVQFYIADGKYRMQVFALEDLSDGNITLYCVDVVKQAVAAGALRDRNGSAAQPQQIALPGSGETLLIESLDGQTANPAAFYKDMVGWNRRAIRIVLPVNASRDQIKAAEALCAISASTWK